MKIIIFLDDHNGYCFNHRRQSRDVLLRKHLAKYLNGQLLQISTYSSDLFACEDFSFIVNDSFSKTNWNLIEIRDISPYFDQIDEILLYRWNRTYPYDLSVAADFFNYFDIIDTQSLKGKSHDKIDFIHYLRKGVANEKME